jgi:Protein of unknown function (DUF2612)
VTGPQDVPFYPPRPGPTTNSIGEFEIGVSAIGSIPPFNWLATVISQYANSPIMLALLASAFAALDQTENFDLLYDNIWNLDTAQGYGLDVWGRIVGVVRTLQVSAGKFVGFEEGGTLDYDVLGPGGSSPFYSGSGATTNYSLTDDAFRTLIRAKALANISDDSIPALNQLLLTLFPGRGNCYATDDGGMTMTWHFDFALTPVEEAIVYQSGVLPKPTGVAASIVIGP